MILKSLPQRKVKQPPSADILVAAVLVPQSTSLSAAPLTDQDGRPRPDGDLSIYTAAPAVCGTQRRVITNSFKCEVQATTESNLLHFLISLRISAEILELPIPVCYYEK